MRSCPKYYAYLNGEVVASGTRNEIARKLNVTPSMVNYAIQRNIKCDHKYEIVKNGTTTYSTSKHGKEEIKWEFGLDEIYLHLNKYGNTITMKDPQQYVEPLKERGIEFEYRKINNHWLLEVVSG